MAKLYEIDNAILECVDEETGEIIDAEKLAELQMERDQKIEKIALWYKNLLSDAEAYKAEKQVFAEKQKVAQNKAESLKSWLATALNGDKFKTSKVDINYRKSTAVIVDDVSLLGADFVKVAEPQPDKAAIKRAIKEGFEVDGAHIESRENISIK